MTSCLALLPKKYVSVDEQFEKYIKDLVSLPSVSSTMYRGYAESAVFGLLYLMRRNPDECIVTQNIMHMANRLKDSKLNLDDLSALDWTDVGCVWDTQKLFFPGNVTEQEYIENTRKCLQNRPNARFSVCILNLIGDTARHANILLYDRVSGDAERFDPYQSVIPNMKMSRLDRLLEKMFWKMFRRGKYRKPADLSFFGTGIQSSQEQENEISQFDPYGFCQPWTFMLADTWMSFPNRSTVSIVQSYREVVENKGIMLTNFIRNYSEHLYRTAQSIFARLNEGVVLEDIVDARVPFLMMVFEHLLIYQDVISQ